MLACYLLVKVSDLKLKKSQCDFISECKNPHCLTDAVSLHVALVGHAVPPQTLVGIVSRETILHPVVGHRGDHQQDVAHDATEQTPSHEAVHLELRLSGLCGAPWM